MGRKAKPFRLRGLWQTNVAGKKHRLCKDTETEKTARKLLDRLHREREVNPHAHLFSDITLEQAAAEFLVYTETENDPATTQHYRSKLIPLVDRLGKRPLRSIRQADGVDYKRWLMDHVNCRGKPYSPTTINHHLRAAKRLLNWATDEVEYLTRNPWRGRKLKLLREEGRKRIITDPEFRALLRNCSDALFKQMLVVLRYSAMRPGEIRKLRWRHIR